jgi:AraC-like DNA-binding protein
MPQRQRTPGPTHRFESNTIQGEDGFHTHDGGQFILVESGISHLRTEAGAWIIPSRRIGWVPPGVSHSSRSSGSGRGWVILAPKRFARSLPRKVCVLRASALLAASLGQLIRLAPGDARYRHLLWQVVAAEMKLAPPEPLEVPMPTTPRMTKAAQGILDAPSIAEPIANIAVRCQMSRRSFARHFKDETGLSFAQWQRTVITHHALERIASGRTVNTVAFEVGYESVSAFIAMFRRHYGASPKEFLGKHSEQYLQLDKTEAQALR